MNEPKIVNILGVDVKCLTYSLNYNDHLNYYYTPEENYSEEDLEGIDTSKDIYQLQIYPRTPVGFIRITANSIEELQEELKKGI